MQRELSYRAALRRTVEEFKRDLERYAPVAPSIEKNIKRQISDIETELAKREGKGKKEKGVLAIDDVVDRVKGTDSLSHRLLKEFDGLKDALLQLVGIKGNDDDYGESDESPEPIDALFPVESTIALKALDDAAEFGSSLISFKGTDGRDWLLTFTTNAFEDREGEIFATKSIEDYVTRHEFDDIKGEYQFWHLPGTKFGDIRWQGTVGRFLVEAGTYDDTPTGQAFKSFFERHPNGHPDLAPDGWGCSHKYEYKSRDQDDGVYEWFEKSETTVLPLDAAANPYTSPLFLSKEKTMNERQLRALKLIGGDRLVSMVQEVGEKATVELEQNVAFKATADYPAQLEELANGLEGDAKEKALSMAKAMRKMPPWLKKPADGEDEGEDEEEEEGMEKKPAEKEPAEKKPAKKKQVTEADETPETDGADETETGEVTGTPEAAEPAPAPAPTPTVDEKAYRDAVAESFKGMIDHFNAKIEALETEVKTLKGDVTDVKKADEEKIARKAALTPAASLLSTVQRAIGMKETKVDGRTEYGRDRPMETPSDPAGLTPVPILNAFITNSDQKQQ
jgi:hypothetical protein